MYVRGLDFHLDRCSLNVLSDLEKNFVLGVSVQAGEEVRRRANSPWYIGDLFCEIVVQNHRRSMGGWNYFALKKPGDGIFVR